MIKKWLRNLVEFVFSSYLAELRQINLKMTLLLMHFEGNQKQPKKDGAGFTNVHVDSGFMNLQPLQPLSKGGSIYPAEE